MSQITLNIPNPLAARESLFLSTDGEPFTTSRAVAERYGKRHADVLRVIGNILSKPTDPEFNERNFAFVTYPDRKGEERPEYRMTHDGFAFLASKLTGKKADAWMIAFIRAFNTLEAELRAKEARFAHALDQIRPTLRPVVECTEQGQSRAEIAQQVNRTPATITRTRNKARTLGLLPQLH
jgi:Rha family phage regulatory protein